MSFSIFFTGRSDAAFIRRQRGLVLFSVLAFALVPLAALAINDIEPGKEFYTATPATGPIIIDGVLSEWDAVPILSDPKFAVPKFSGTNASPNYVLFEPFSGGIWTGPDDQSSGLQVAWDADNVYLGIVVTDDYHENAARSAWNGDAVQLMIANDLRNTQIALYDYALAGIETDANLNNLTNVLVFYEAGPSGNPGCSCPTIAVVARNTNTHKTVYEIKLPAASLGLTAPLQAGTKFGLGMAINDGDDGAGQNGQKGWGGLGAHAIVFGKSPSETALITLGAPPPPTPVTWVGTSGDWNTPTNWSTGAIPGPTDDVVIDVAGNQTITCSSGTHSINSLQCAENFVLSGASLTIANAAQFTASFTISGGTLSGSGDVTISGSLNWIAGTMNGTGKTIIANTGTLNLAGSPSLNRVLQNDGAAIWTEGELQMNGGTLNNNGSFTANSDGELDCFGNGGVNAFNNAGTFTKQQNALTLFFENTTTVSFNNSGTVNVQAGTLWLDAGGTHSGPFTVAGGATLRLNQTHTFTAAATVTGSGELSVIGGAATFAGSFTGGGLTISGGRATFNNNVSFASGNFSGTTLSGSGDLTITGNLNWTGGTMSGTGKTIITSTGALNLSGAVSLNRVLQNDGAATWTGGELQMNGGTFNNSGSFIANSNGELDCFGLGGVNVFNNAGTFTQQGFGLTVFFPNFTGVNFNNSGTVNVQAGTLALQSGGTQSGPFTVAGGATLRLDGTQTFGAAATVTGSGELRVVGGAATFAGSFTGGSLTISAGTVTFNNSVGFGSGNFSGGTLLGSGDLTITGPLNWTGGTMSGSGKTIITSTSVLNLIGSVSRQLNRVLQNDGTVTWTGGTFQMNGATFNNNGRFTASSNGQLDCFGLGGVNVFNNTGTFTKQGTGLTIFYHQNVTAVNFNNSGAVNVQAGTLQISNSTLANTATGTISGSGTLDVTSAASFANNGTVAPGSPIGALNVIGNYPETPASALNVEIGGVAPGSFDQLKVSGTATLAGTLNVSFVNGYVPAVGDSFPILTYGTRSGTFASAPGAGTTFNLQYNSTNVVLVIRPPPSAAPTISDIPDQTLNEDAVLTNIPFTVGDDQTPAGSLLLSASSTNTTLVPLANIVFGGAGANRTVTVIPATNQFGTTLLTVTVTDGEGNTGSDSFLVTVNPVNDPPTLNQPSNPAAINEDAGLQTVNLSGISAGGGENQALTVTATSDNTTLIPNPTVNYTSPNSTGSLSYSPVANASGSAVITVTVRDAGLDGIPGNADDGTVSRTFTVLVNAVNDPPSFTKGADQQVNEDSGPQSIVGWATAINAGPNESSQTVSFNITGNSNPSLFVAGPAVSSTGTLTYTPAANANGTATITLVAQDNGGTANGGVDTSAPQTFTITVTGVNDAPSFAKGADQTVNEDAGPQTVVGWATAISAGPANEVGQTVSFTIAFNSNPSLFAAGPAVSSSGTLTYTPAANANGAAVLILVLQDNGGTGNGGVDTSAAQSFTITVNPVNDAPSFAKGPDQILTQNAGPQSIPGWATAISPGPANESNQAVSFLITGNSNPALFAAGPAVSPTGTLSYTAITNANGSAVITLVAQDNGGTANGGVDTSAPQSFIITVSITEPPKITTAPQSQTLLLGSSISLFVEASGTPPLLYQWRHNGANILSATGATYTISGFRLADAGNYSVAVQNQFGVAASAPAQILPVLPSAPLNDNFAARSTITTATFTGQGNNRGATKEPGEPNHAGNPGGKSVWFRWTPPVSGIATISTAGSTFDTLLAVYRGATLAGLNLVVQDDDSGGFFASLVQFNVVAGQSYEVAIDGSGGAAGDIVLNLSVEPTLDPMPEITAQPASQTVPLGAPATFFVTARTTSTTPPLTYQWIQDDVAIPGATASTYSIANAQTVHVGTYKVRVSQGTRAVLSQPAVLQINTSAIGTLVDNVVTADKLADAVAALFGQSTQTGNFIPRPLPPRPPPGTASGYTGTQIFRTKGKTKDEGEPNHCGVLGGASDIFPYTASDDAVFQLNTDGADFDTVLAVYTNPNRGPNVTWSTMVPVACDDNRGRGGTNSAVAFPVTRGTVYYIVVVGKNGEEFGVVPLNYRLVGPVRITSWAFNAGQFQLQFIGQPGGVFLLQGSSSLTTTWPTLLTTNSASGNVTYRDTNPPTIGRRYYRVLQQ